MKAGAWRIVQADRNESRLRKKNCALREYGQDFLKGAAAKTVVGYNRYDIDSEGEGMTIDGDLMLARSIENGQD